MNGEAAIYINGKPLNVGQAMTVRVAISAFVSSLNNGGDKALGDDAHGRAMTTSYIARGMEVLRMMTTYEETIPSPAQPSPDSQGTEPAKPVPGQGQG